MMEKFNELEPKQKVMAIATGVLFIILAYLVYSTFFAGSGASSPSPTPSATPKITSTTTPTTTTPVQKTVTSVQQVETPQTTPEEQALLKRSKDVEEQYLKLVSQYQIAQLQQKLAQTNAQIAQSRLSTVKAMAEAKKLDSQAAQATGTTITAPAAATPHEEVKTIKAMYVGTRGGRWMAMLDLDGSYYQVHVGTRLPNGTLVSMINKNGVVLTHDGKRYYLAIPTHLDK